MSVRHRSKLLRLQQAARAGQICGGTGLRLMRVRVRLQEFSGSRLVVNDQNHGFAHVQRPDQPLGSANTMRKILPPPARGHTEAWRRWSAQSSRAMNSPRPVPRCSPLKKGSKIRSACPARRRGRDRQSPGKAARRDQAPETNFDRHRRASARAVACMAFSHRFHTTWCSWDRGYPGADPRVAQPRAAPVRDDPSASGLVSILTLTSRSGRHCMVSQNSSRKSLSQAASSCSLDAGALAARQLQDIIDDALMRSAFSAMISVRRRSSPAAAAIPPAAARRGSWRRPDCGSHGRCWR